MESISVQLTWPQGSGVTDLDVEVDILDYGTRATVDMPAEGPTCRITSVTEVILVDDVEVTHAWDIADLPKGFVELVEDVVAQMQLAPTEDDDDEVRFDDLEVLYASMEYAERGAERHRDSDYWL